MVIVYFWQEKLANPQLIPLNCATQVMTCLALCLSVSFSLSTQSHTHHLMNWPTSCEILQLQFQNDMHLPLTMGGAQESQPLSWLPDNENQHIILPDGTNFLPQR